MTSMWKLGAVLFAIGAILGTMCDGFHTWGGQTTYAHPMILRAPLWVPLLFGLAAVGIGFGRLAFDRMLQIREQISMRQAALAMGFFIAAYAFTGFVGWDEVRIANVVLFAALIAWSIWDRRADGLVFMLLVAFIGTGIEMLLVRSGVFFYAQSTLDGVALWLPSLYLLAAVSVGTLTRALADALCPPPTFRME